MTRHGPKRDRRRLRRRVAARPGSSALVGSGGRTPDLVGVDRDRGGTLTELLVTIVIMGVVLAPVMDAVIGAITASSTNRGLANVETALHNAADKVNRARRSCDYSIYASAAAQSMGWPMSAASVEQLHYLPAASPTQTGTWVTGACPATGLEDLLVQLVNITITNPDTGGRRTIQVVKSDV